MMKGCGFLVYVHHPHPVESKSITHLLLFFLVLFLPEPFPRWKIMKPVLRRNETLDNP